MDLIKLAAAAWLGACLRNENDRKKTLEFFNSIGVETEKVIKGAFRGKTNQMPQQPDNEQEFI